MSRVQPRWPKATSTKSRKPDVEFLDPCRGCPLQGNCVLNSLAGSEEPPGRPRGSLVRCAWRRAEDEVLDCIRRAKAGWRN